MDAQVSGMYHRQFTMNNTGYCTTRVYLPGVVSMFLDKGDNCVLVRDIPVC